MQLQPLEDTLERLSCHPVTLSAEDTWVTPRDSTKSHPTMQVRDWLCASMGEVARIRRQLHSIYPSSGSIYISGPELVPATGERWRCDLCSTVCIQPRNPLDSFPRSQPFKSFEAAAAHEAVCADTVERRSESLTQSHRVSEMQCKY